MIRLSGIFYQRLMVRLLDVYKRQIRRFLCISDRVVGILKSSGISGRRDHAAGRNLGVERADTFPCSVAVSYTHLDVYKRQV